MNVDENGGVLKQEAKCLGARLPFVRRADKDAEALVKRIDEEQVGDAPKFDHGVEAKPMQKATAEEIE